MVPIGHGLFQGLQQHCADAAAKNGSLAGLIERTAMSVQGLEVALFRKVAVDLRHTHHRSSTSIMSHSLKSQVLARLVDRDQ